MMARGQPGRGGPASVLLRRHNLNLVPILRELLRTRSVGRTASNIGLSQSAVSAALGRLREIYDDDLLVMVGRRLELTGKGQQLIEPAERACLELEALLSPTAFDPSTETRRFVIETADYVAYLLAPILAEQFAVQAPRASVHFVDIRPDIGPRLAQGGFDVIALPEDTAGALKERAGSSRLFEDEIVVIASGRHKTFEGELTREVYESSRHAMFRLPTRNATSHESEVLRRSGVQHHNVVLVEHFLTLPAVVEQSGCLALIQRRLAERFAHNHDIEIHRPPFPALPVVISAYWAHGMDRDPAHAWFRNLLISACALIEAPPRRSK